MRLLLGSKYRYAKNAFAAGALPRTFGGPLRSVDGRRRGREERGPCNCIFPVAFLPQSAPGWQRWRFRAVRRKRLNQYEFPSHVKNVLSLGLWVISRPLPLDRARKFASFDTIHNNICSSFSGLNGIKRQKVSFFQMLRTVVRRISYLRLTSELLAVVYLLP